MKNFSQPGQVAEVIAPYAVVSGEGVLVGKLFGAAQGAAAISAQVRVNRFGVHSMKKTSAQAWTQGALIYWDNAARECTTVVGANLLVGIAFAAAVNPSAVGLVYLDGAAR